MRDDVHFLLQRTDAVTVKVFSKKLQLLNPKQTLGWVDEDAMLVEALKDQPYILLVLVWVSTGDENIVNIGIA